jgi:HEAT repeat protein
MGAFLRRFLILVGFISSLVADEASRRIYDHLVLGDTLTAVFEAKKAYEENQESKDVQKALIHALAYQGDEIATLEHWEKLIAHHEEEKRNRNLLEALAWGVLVKGEKSSQINIRLNSLIGMSFTRNAKAVGMIRMLMRDSSAYIRSVAIQMAAMYGDLPLQEELASLLKKEKVWYVRLEAIKAVGQLKLTEFCPLLKEIVASKKTLAEEKFAAIISLVGMYETVDEKELKALAASDRSGLRHLACELISHFDLIDRLEIIYPLLSDTSYDVQISAMNVIALLRPALKTEVKQSIDLLTESPQAAVSLTAHWLQLLYGDARGEKALLKAVENEEAKVRRIASAALAASGRRGVKASKEALMKTSDPYVMVNLALGLLGQRVDLELACEKISTLLNVEKRGLWMWDSSANPLFRSLAPSTLTHIEQIPNYPAVANAIIELELLTALSLVNAPDVQKSVKKFLQSTHFGIAGAAALHLLTEGDEGAIELVRTLLSDEDEMIRTQAALILAALGGDRSVVPILERAYYHVDRQMKIYIVEALAHMGEAHSIPFLIEILKEPFQNLRVVAASALIRCLN